MQKCKKCGKEIPNDMKFCPYCGEPVETPAPQQAEPRKEEVREEVRPGLGDTEGGSQSGRSVRCHNCGQMNSAEHAYCTFCGAPLQGASGNTGEYFLGGLSSANLNRGSMGGYAIYVTNKRIFGVSKKAGVIAGTVAGAAAGWATGITIGAGIGYAAGAKATSKINFPPIAELVNKCDFVVTADDIGRVELTPPYLVNGGSMVIYRRSGGIIDIGISGGGSNEFNTLKDLLSKFFKTKPIEVMPKQRLPKGKLFVVQNQNRVSGARRKFSKGVTFLIAGVVFLIIFIAIFAGLTLIANGIFFGFGIGAVIAGFILLATGFGIFYSVMRGSRRATWKIFTIIFVIALASSSFLVLQDNGVIHFPIGSSGAESKNVYIMGNESYIYNNSGGSIYCLITLGSRSGVLTASDVSSVTIDGLRANLPLVVSRNGTVAIVAWVKMENSSNVYEVNAVVYLSDGNFVSANLSFPGAVPPQIIQATRFTYNSSSHLRYNEKSFRAVVEDSE
ncbi:MAG: zinc-ribbon domain-containing protein [Candidatus Parvarchaeota archaeon]